MSPREEEFLQMLRSTFKAEAGEHLQSIAGGLLELEKAPAGDDQRRLLESVFRAAHSLKGAARAVGYTQIEAICQSLEDLFAGWKSAATALSAAALDTAHRALDAVSIAMTEPAGSDTAAALRSQAPAAAPPEPGAETVRIAVDKLDARLLEAEEMLAAKLAVGQRSIELGALLHQFGPWLAAWAKARPQARTLRVTRGQEGLAEFFEWSGDYLRTLESEVASLCRSAEQDRFMVGRLVDDLLADSKKLLMLPLATLASLLAKVARDLCRDQGKEAELMLHGEAVEIDKRILEEMKDPLIHLLRNCIDHGIETPERRKAQGKPARATITVALAKINGSQVELLVTDDGAGIDVERLKSSAVGRGLLSVQAAGRMSEAEALNLIFTPEVSTSPMVTQVSGRGLGLAIVREKAEKLGGRVTVESRRGAGTSIRVSLPVTLSTFRGVLVRVAERPFVLPTAEVERVARYTPLDVQTVEGRETLLFAGRTVSLVRLAEVLELPAAVRPQAAFTPVVILGTGEQRVAFAVDAVLDEQELLLKRLRKPLVRVRHVAGAAVLGSGQVAVILKAADLLESARKAGAPAPEASGVQRARRQAKSILLAEDSITSRLLLKGILESAGYQVKTAVDGLEAYTALRAGQFDLLVSDVEMPRLDGFALTMRVRADKKLAELPVVLVTALETPADREAGIASGANAYLVKSSFDQSNLLEAVRRLL